MIIKIIKIKITMFRLIKMILDKTIIYNRNKKLNKIMDKYII